MTTLKSIIALIVGLAIGVTLHAQGEIEALRFSQMDNLGSARIMGMASAGSSLGTDASSALLNPAGLAQLRRGELIISPTFMLNNIQTRYLDASGSRNTSQLQLSNLALAIVSPRYVGYGRKRKQASSGLLQTTFAAGYQKLASYKRVTRATGYNQYSSITDAFAENANGLTVDDFNIFNFSGLAWETYAINPIAGRENEYFGSGVGGNLEQRIRITESGNRGVFFAAVGLNFDDVIYVGATLTGLSLSHSYRWQYEEEDINDLHNFYEDNPNSPFPLEYPMNSLLARDSIVTTGNGVSGKLGVIVKPADNVRVGISFQLPGILLNNEVYRREMLHVRTLLDQNGQDSIGYEARATGEAEGSYNLITPYGFSLGGTYLFGKQGFVTADVEVVDYSSARLRSPYLDDDPFYYSYSSENDRIADFYQPALNLSLGGEYRSDMIRLRAGAGYRGTALTEEARTYENPDEPGQTLVADLTGMVYSAGLGVRGESAFMDIAFQHQTTKSKMSPYATSDPAGFDPTLLSTQATNRIMLTLGVKW